MPDSDNLIQQLVNYDRRFARIERAIQGIDDKVDDTEFAQMVTTPSRLLGRGHFTASGFTGAAKYIPLADGTFLASATDSNKAASDIFYFDPAEQVITGKTVNMKIRARVKMGLTNALGTGITLTVHLADLTFTNGGAANTMRYTFGTSRMNSTSASNLAANSLTTLDINPTDASAWPAGYYSIWWEVAGGTPTGVGVCTSEASLEWN